MSQHQENVPPSPGSAWEAPCGDTPDSAKCTNMAMNFLWESTSRHWWVRVPTQEATSRLIHVIDGSQGCLGPEQIASLSFATVVFEVLKNWIFGYNALIIRALASGSLVALFGLERDAEHVFSRLETAVADDSAVFS